MSIHDSLTEEQECAVVHGYIAAWSGGIREPPESYKDNTSLLVCWYWGYSQWEKYKPVH